MVTEVWEPPSKIKLEGIAKNFCFSSNEICEQQCKEKQEIGNFEMKNLKFNKKKHFHFLEAFNGWCDRSSILKTQVTCHCESLITIEISIVWLVAKGSISSLDFALILPFIQSGTLFSFQAESV